MYVNGEWLRDGPTFSVHNPATGETLSEVFDGNISALEAGIGAFPRRLAVSTAQRLAAETVLRDAEEYYDD